MRRRQDRTDRAPGELTVADLATAGRAHAAGLADRIGREIVVQHEGDLVGALEAVDHLLVLAGAERRDHQRLRLAASEQRRAVGARKHANLRHDLADGLQVAAVDALAVVEDAAADDVALQLLEEVGDHLCGGRIRGVRRAKLGLHLVLHRLNGVLALGLAGDRVGAAELVGGYRAHAVIERGAVRNDVLARLLGGPLGELDDRLDDGLERAVAEHDGAEHHVLGELVGFRFHHQHRVSCAGDDEVELRLLHLVDERVENVIAVDVADAGAADGAHEGHAGKRQRGGSGNHGDDVGIVLKIVRENGGDHLRVVLVAGGEERTDGPVDEARGQRLLLGRTALALEEAARNAAGGEVFFLVVHGEREEVEARLRLALRYDGGEHRGLAIGGKHGAVGLARHAPRLEGELPPAPFDRYFLDIKHGSSFRSCESRTGHVQDGGALRADNPAHERPAILPWPFPHCWTFNGRPPRSSAAARPSGAVQAAKSAPDSATSHSI